MVVITRHVHAWLYAAHGLVSVISSSCTFGARLGVFCCCTDFGRGPLLWNFGQGISLGFILGYSSGRSLFFCLNFGFFILLHFVRGSESDDFRALRVGLSAPFPCQLVVFVQVDKVGYDLQNSLQPVARRLSNKRVKNLRFVELQAVFAEGIDLILLLLYLGQECAYIVSTRRKGYIFELLLFLVIINDKLWLHHSHCDIEEYQTTNNLAACNLVRVQIDVHLWLGLCVARPCDIILEDKVKSP